MNVVSIQEHLSHKTVGIAGCGGLGSNCAVALARIGIGKLILIDFDRVEASNLNRQYYFQNQIGQFKVDALANNIGLINPKVDVQTHKQKIGPGDAENLFSACNVVVEAFDRADMKQMLVEDMLLNLPDKPLVVGLGMAGWGHSNAIRLRQSDTLYICGDEESEVRDEWPPLAPRVGMVANMQANTVLDLLMNMK